MEFSHIYIIHLTKLAYKIPEKSIHYSSRITGKKGGNDRLVWDDSFTSHWKETCINNILTLETEHIMFYDTPFIKH